MNTSPSKDSRLSGRESVTGDNAREKVRMAVEFISSHSPIPPDANISTGLYDEFCEAINTLAECPNPGHIQLLFRAIGQRSSAPICESFLDVLRAQDEDDVVRHLEAALESGTPCVVEWAARYAMDFPSPALIETLSSVLCHAESTKDAVLFAVEALQRFRDTLHLASIDTILEEKFQNNPLWSDLREQIRKTDEALQTAGFRSKISKSKEAFSSKKYALVVQLLEPFEDQLAEPETTRLMLAREYLKKKAP